MKRFIVTLNLDGDQGNLDAGVFWLSGWLHEENPSVRTRRAPWLGWHEGGGGRALDTGASDMKRENFREPSGQQSLCSTPSLAGFKFARFWAQANLLFDFKCFVQVSECASANLRDGSWWQLCLLTLLVSREPAYPSVWVGSPGVALFFCFLPPSGFCFLRAFFVTFDS